MLFLKHIRLMDFGLLFVAALITIGSLYLSHILVCDLSNEERGKVEVWAEAIRNLQNADDGTDLSMVLKVLNANNTIPVIVVNQQDEVQTYRNIDVAANDTLAFLTEKFRKFIGEGNAIRIDLNNAGEYLIVCYGNSNLLHRLATYPYIQLAVVLVFVCIAIFALLSAKRAEQNKVWVGLSKETAHQLGTPISSLMAWAELLKAQYPKDELLPAMVEDIERLQVVANRFSKIGSSPDLEKTNMVMLASHVLEYMRHRTSDKVDIRFESADEVIEAMVNPSLFEWVLENLCKNAVDAMNGMGILTILLSQDDKKCYIEVQDTGKGIDKRHLYSVFTPGYTTKKRGWGLGLSLSKRIVEEYHFGIIYVKKSELNKGTTFRIELKK